MTVTFAAFGEVPESLGFDAEVTPPWVMVPLGGTKKIVLKDGAGLTLALQNAGDAGTVGFRELGAAAGGTLVELTGQKAGKCTLNALDASRAAKASVEISVKAPLKLATFIGFVFDKSNRAPVRGLEDALSVVGIANKIMAPQTNLELFRKDSGQIRLPFEMPAGMPADLSPFNAPQAWMRGGPGMLPCISSQPLGPNGCALETAPGILKPEEFRALVEYQMLVNIVSRISPGFDYNILCVRNFSTSTGISAATGAFTPVSMNGVALHVCFMPDPARGQSLAHELCHFLLRTSFLKGGHSTGKNDLMNSSPGPNNIKIPKQQANAINPSGA